jgi:transcriptional regulator with XRE-family HTH domain
VKNDKIERKFFAEQLKKLLYDKRLTHQNLADMLGVNRPMITRWITGGRYPSFVSVKKIADALGVSVEYFTENKNKKKDEDFISRKEVNKIIAIKDQEIKLLKEKISFLEEKLIFYKAAR